MELYHNNPSELNLDFQELSSQLLILVNPPLALPTRTATHPTEIAGTWKCTAVRCSQGEQQSMKKDDEFKSISKTSIIF